MWTQSCSKSDFWNAFWNAKKGVLDRDPDLESLILGHVNAKLFRNVIRACAFWKCALKPCWSHAWVNQRGLRSRNKILPRSAQILIVIGNAFAMHVNARRSIHDPNHVLDRDPKHLSERDSGPCEHSHCSFLTLSYLWAPPFEKIANIFLPPPPHYATISQVPESVGHKPKCNENNSCGCCLRIAPISLVLESESHKPKRNENNGYSCGVTQQHNKPLSINGSILSIMVYKQLVHICLRFNVPLTKDTCKWWAGQGKSLFRNRGMNCPSKRC